MWSVLLYIYRSVEVTLTRVLVTAFRKFYGQVSDRGIFAVGSIQGVDTALFRFYIESQIFPENPRTSEDALLERALSRRKIGYLHPIRKSEIDGVWLFMERFAHSAENLSFYVNSRDIQEWYRTPLLSTARSHGALRKLCHCTRSPWHENEIRLLCHVLERDQLFSAREYERIK